MLPSLSAASSLTLWLSSWRRQLGGAQEVLRDRAHVEAGPNLYALDAAQGAAVSNAQALRLCSSEAAGLAIKRIELVIYYGQVGLRSQQEVCPNEQSHETYNLQTRIY